MLVSVIIPTFNRGKFISEAIDSVLAQTYQEIEIIVVDDGSKDNTSEIVQRYRDRVRYIYQTNQGVSVARNHGFDESKGQFISFLDSDDLFLPNKIEKMVSFLECNEDYGLVYSDMILIDENGKFLSYWLIRMKYYGEGHIYFNLLKECFFNPTGVVVKRNVFLDAGKFNEDIRSIEDLDLWLKIAQKTKIGLIKEPLVKWRQHGNNASQNTRLNNPNLVKVFKNQLSLNLNKNERAVVFKTLSLAYFELGLFNLSDGYIREAQDMFRKSLFYGFRFKSILFQFVLMIRIFDRILLKRFDRKY